MTELPPLPRSLVLRPGVQGGKQDQDAPPLRRPDEPAPGQPETLEKGAPQGPQSKGPGGACMNDSMIWMFLPMILLFYFLLIRPQQKQEKARRQMLGALKKGDKVVTSGGIHGVITNLSDRTVTLRFDTEGKSKMILDRDHIGRILGDEPKEKGKAG